MSESTHRSFRNGYAVRQEFARCGRNIGVHKSVERLDFASMFRSIIGWQIIKVPNFDKAVKIRHFLCIIIHAVIQERIVRLGQVSTLKTGKFSRLRP